MALSTKEFMDRLESISRYNNEPYARCHLLLEEEHAYGVAVASQMSGYLALSDAFKSFYLETVERLNTECRPKVTKRLSEFYPLFLARLNNNFETLVASERVALHGYPHQAFTLHRNNFDNAVLTVKSRCCCRFGRGMRVLRGMRLRRRRCCAARGVAIRVVSSRNR